MFTWGPTDTRICTDNGRQQSALFIHFKRRRTCLLCSHLCRTGLDADWLLPCGAPVSGSTCIYPRLFWVFFSFNLSPSVYSRVGEKKIIHPPPSGFTCSSYRLAGLSCRCSPEPCWVEAPLGTCRWMNLHPEKRRNRLYGRFFSACDGAAAS